MRITFDLRFDLDKSDHDPRLPRYFFRPRPSRQKHDLPRAAIMVVGVWLDSLLWWLMLTLGSDRCPDPSRGASEMDQPCLGDHSFAVRGRAARRTADRTYELMPPRLGYGRRLWFTCHLPSRKTPGKYRWSTSSGTISACSSGTVPRGSWPAISRSLSSATASCLHLHGHAVAGGPNPQVGDLARGGEVLAIFHAPTTPTSRPIGYMTGPECADVELRWMCMPMGTVQLGRGNKCRIGCGGVWSVGWNATRPAIRSRGQCRICPRPMSRP